MAPLELVEACPERLSEERSQAISALLMELATIPPVGEGWDEVLRPGKRVGRFELLGEIGRGGFGIVYEARDRELGRSVAFKAVRPGRGPDERAREILLHEAQSIARLSHPNLVTLHDVGRCDQGPYLVLELLRGMTLSQRLRSGPLTVPDTLRVGIEVSRGLAHAHRAGVVHRDLKPSNVFLCEGDHVKVLDFGMAHAFGRARTMGGTPAYMAPEQWRDAPEDERTDVFALGVMLYQMLDGEVPLAEGGKSLADRPAPRLDVPTLPALAALVARMLERDPADRPRDAVEVLAALRSFGEAVHSGEEITARLPLPSRPAPPRRLLAAGVAAALALCGLAAWVGLSAMRPGPAPVPAAALHPGTGRAPARDPVAHGLYLKLVDRMIELGRLDEAEEACRRAQELSPDGAAPPACAALRVRR